MGALTVDRKALAVTEAAVAADLHQTGGVLPHLAAKVALGGEVGINVVTDLGDLILGQILDAGVGVHTGLSADLGGAGAADAINVGESDLDALLARQIDAVNTGQLKLLP